MIKKTGNKSSRHFDAAKHNGTKRKVTDPTKLHDLGWKHKIDIENGVEMIYEWYNK